MRSIKFILLLTAVLPLLACSRADQDFPIKHPIKNPPGYTEHLRCENCGMDRNMFARTRYAFETRRGRHYVCSLACVVILSMKLKEEPGKVEVAEYLHPENMIDAGRAIYVIGSKARGTMTRVSKMAFSERKEAELVVARYGGMLAGFDEAFLDAKKEVQLHAR